MSSIFSSKLFGSKQPPRRKEILRGEHKVLFEAPSFDSLVILFNDHLNLNGKTEVISGLGSIHQRSSEILFSHLSDLGIRNHFQKSLNMREQLVYAAEVLGFSVRVHTTVMEDLASKFKMQIGTILPSPLIEFVTADKDAHTLSKDHILTFDMADESEIFEVETLAKRTCDTLYGFFAAKGMRLTSIDLSFGRTYSDDPFEDSEVMLIDELTPRTIHLVDMETGEDFSLKSAFERDANLAEIYQNYAQRLNIIKSSPLEETTDVE